MPDLAARRCFDRCGRVVGREVMLGLETADVAGEPDERAQGFLFSKPVTAGDIDRLVLERVSFDVPSELAL